MFSLKFIGFGDTIGLPEVFGLWSGRWGEMSYLWEDVECLDETFPAAARDVLVVYDLFLEAAVIGLAW